MLGFGWFSSDLAIYIPLEPDISKTKSLPLASADLNIGGILHSSDHLGFHLELLLLVPADTFEGGPIHVMLPSANRGLF